MTENLPPENQDTHELELRAKDREIERLKKEIEFIETQKRLIEQSLSLVRTERQLEQKQLQVGLSIGHLKMDWMAKAKELEALKTNPDPELRDALVIDFANQFRVHMFNEVDKDEDSIVVIKAIAYETGYKMCVAVMENRNLRIKLQQRDAFTQAVKDQKETKNQKTREKVEKDIQKERSKDPREKMVDTYMAFGMTRADAETQVDKLLNAGKELTKK